jgi:hypothetical protein
VPVKETCDGRDSDCDGVVDNGVTNACGACGAVPAEVCDGKDNNCDGAIDEGVKNACGACGRVPAEVCDAKDNDCDGLVDELLKNACGGPCDAPVPKEDCATAADDNCNGQTNEGCAVCGDARITSPEECDPKASGWSAFTCGPDCKRNTMYGACQTDADCFGSVGRSTVICNGEYGICSIMCPREGATGTASGCPKAPGNLTATCTAITGDFLFCFAMGCMASNESGGGGCAPGTTCAANDQASWCVNL